MAFLRNANLFLLGTALLVAGLAGCTSANAVSNTGVDLAYIQQNADAICLVDVRPYEQYAGNDADDERAGHIPGAVSIAADKLYKKDGQPIEEARQQRIFAHQGLHADDQIVLYGDDEDTARVASLLQAQGFNDVDVYEAGFDEWAAADDTLVEKAPKSCCAIE